MSLTARPRVPLPQIESSPVSSPLTERKRSVIFKLHSPQAIRPLKLSELHDMSPPPKSVSQNMKIDSIVRRMNRKLNILHKDKTRRFDEKMKIFGNLETFIDIKDYLKQMNELNTSPEEKTTRVPRFNLNEVNNLNMSPNQEGFNPFSSNYPSSPKVNMNPSIQILGENAKEVTSSEPQKEPNEDFIIRRKKKQSLTDIVQRKEGDINFKKTSHAYDAIAEKANVLLNQMNLADKRNSIIEDTDVNNFYLTLHENFLTNKFEKNDIDYTQPKAEEFELYRELLDLQNEKDMATGNYYETYKARADKVISLLRKATKHIYNKTTDPNRIRASRLSNPDTLAKKPIENKLPHEKAEIKNQWKMHLESLLASGKFMDGSLKGVSEKELSSHFDKMLEKTSTMTQISPRGNRKALSLIGDKTNGKLDNFMNRRVNKAHKNYLKTILDCVQTNELNFKNMKDDLSKKINVLEYTYERETQKLLPKNVESIRTVDSKTAGMTFIDKPVRKNFSRSILNALT